MSISYSSGSTTPLVNPNNVLTNTQSAASSGGVLITVPAGRTWQGWIASNMAIATNAGTAGLNAVAYFQTGGAGVIPNLDGFYVARAATGNDASTGLTGQGVTGRNSGSFTLVAPATNSVTLIWNVGVTGTGYANGDFTAAGVLL